MFIAQPTPCHCTGTRRTTALSYFRTMPMPPSSTPSIQPYLPSSLMLSAEGLGVKRARRALRTVSAYVRGRDGGLPVFDDAKQIQGCFKIALDGCRHEIAHSNGYTATLQADITATWNSARVGFPSPMQGYLSRRPYTASCVRPPLGASCGLLLQPTLGRLTLEVEAALDPCVFAQPSTSSILRPSLSSVAVLDDPHCLTSIVDHNHTKVKVKCYAGGKAEENESGGREKMGKERISQLPLYLSLFASRAVSISHRHQSANHGCAASIFVGPPSMSESGNVDECGVDDAAPLGTLSQSSHNRRGFVLTSIRGICTSALKQKRHPGIDASPSQVKSLGRDRQTHMEQARPFRASHEACARRLGIGKTALMLHPWLQISTACEAPRDRDYTMLYPSLSAGAEGSLWRWLQCY
ncbi:hypothetical protein C8Q72DRAFT_947604 [Fomitopsis betulina]|nr:hypothetical protein C8Q72DRAFT_947604 [Fomitopsis betulina]